MSIPAARRPAPICMWQPGLPVATTRGTGDAAAMPLDLVVEDGAGHVGMQHGVDAGAAAALVGAGKQPEPQAGNGVQHGERLGLDLLRVLQVAGRIVDDIERERAALARSLGREQLGHVAHAGAEVPRPRCVPSR